MSDATRLIEAGFIGKEAGDEDWRDGLRRAGELLEWLNRPELNPAGLPLGLLAAAAYQVAGYPARAFGLLSQHGTEASESQSEILRSLASSDFPQLLELLTKYWKTTQESLGHMLPERNDPNTFAERLHRWVVDQTISCLGVLCAEMRWGSEPRLKTAVEKLSAISGVLLHDYDPYSWLLARLCAEVAAVYLESSMRYHLQALDPGMSRDGRTALERYLRQRYETRKALAWPSQVRGIERLVSGESFALCTPTGSGKTTVAELAILQSLFPGPDHPQRDVLDSVDSEPLAMYLVPSRALAAEVEAKLSRVVHPLGAKPVIITGLYGGTDWGPTDAWLTKQDPTVLICTYEKAEALMRFLGPSFLSRVSLVVIDEAHRIQYDGEVKDLREADSRALRLESLSARLLARLGQTRGRAIALSAAASGIENSLAEWAAGRTGAVPATASYRSTRQLIGQLRCLSGGMFEIWYDLLDGASLRFTEKGKSVSPYIPDPIPVCPRAPAWEKGGPEKRTRPQLFWAAMHLAKPDASGQQHAVLISITQGIGGYAKDLLDLLDSAWASAVPVFFQEPSTPRKRTIWERCLRSCEDYFGQESHEFQLLQKGIVVHHGRMPGPMARLLVEVIECGIVYLVLATSTLTEGVNLPFETVLIPTLRRGSRSLNTREFSNLVGRAGRPGSGTEGRCLVILHPKNQRAGQRYATLIRNMQGNGGDKSAGASSPLAALIGELEQRWRRHTRSLSREAFLDWLEQAAPLETGEDLPPASDAEAMTDALDALDGILLSGIAEAERVAGGELSPVEVEDELKRIWQHSYARYASKEEARLSDLFVRRGRTLRTTIYSNSSLRRRMYCTSLPPRSGKRMLDLYPEVKKHLQGGDEYALWTTDQRFDYIQKVVALIATLEKFRLREKAGRTKVTWQEALRWWLNPSGAETKPTVGQISDWYRYVKDNFEYRFNWALGSIIALAIEEAYGPETWAPSVEQWPRTGLPWVAFWLKELIVWGTLEPVAAFLLARRIVTTRPEAEEAASQYQNEQSPGQAPDQTLNPTVIRKWARKYSDYQQDTLKQELAAIVDVRLLRDFGSAVAKQWRVLPVESHGQLFWLDPAGFPLAVSAVPIDWKSSYLRDFDFALAPRERIVWTKPYLHG